MVLLCKGKECRMKREVIRMACDFLCPWCNARDCPDREDHALSAVVRANLMNSCFADH